MFTKIISSKINDSVNHSDGIDVLVIVTVTLTMIFHPMKLFINEAASQRIFFDYMFSC